MMNQAEDTELVRSGTGLNVEDESPPQDDESKEVSSRASVKIWTSNHIVSKAYEDSQGVLGEGRCGFVLSSVVNEEEVAVKVWKGFDDERKRQLRHEISVFSFMATNYPEIMGQAVPRLIGVGHDEKAGSLLVTEKVGKELRLNGISLLVDGAEVFGKDKTCIRQAVLRSLLSLHTRGILHGTIGLRNLRVEKRELVAQSGKYEWKAWWVDFGRSKLHASGWDLDEELVECGELFD